jgi:hypothetical protein
MQLDVPMGVRQVKRIEDVRDEKDPQFRIWPTRLAFAGNPWDRPTPGLELLPRRHVCV